VKVVVSSVVALLALAVRLGYLLEVQDGPLFATPVLEAAQYVAASPGPLGALPASLAPVYLMLLALLRLVGESLWWPRLFQVLVGSASCVLIWLIGRRIFPPGVALAASLAATAYGPLVYYGGELLPGTIAVFFVLLLLWLLLETPPDPVWRWAAPGLLLGVAVLATPAALLLLPVLLWWLGAWERGLWLAAGCGLVIAPVAVLHGFPLNTDILGGGNVGGAIVGVLGDRLLYFWGGGEIAHDLDLYFARRESTLLSILLWHWWIAFPFGAVAPFGLVGMGLYLRTSEGRSRLGLLLTGFVISGSVAALLYPVTSLTRLPVVPVLLLFACYGCYRMLAGPRRLVAIGIAAMLILALNAGVQPIAAAGTAREHFWRGQAFDTRDMQANAMREYRQALKADPENPDALRRLADLLSRRGEFAAATAMYRKYLQLVPDSIPIRRELAMALLANGEKDEALQEMEQIIALEPERADLHGTLAFVSLVSDRPERATVAYRRVLALRPDSALVRYQLARLHESQDRADSAETQYRLALALTPEHADAHQGLADLLVARAAPRVGEKLEQTVMLQEAEDLLLRALILDAKSLVARWSLGRLLARQGRFHEAIEHFERILELTPDQYEAHLYLGGLYRRTGRAAESEAAFEVYERDKRARQLEVAVRSQSEQLARELLGE